MNVSPEAQIFASQGKCYGYDSWLGLCHHCDAVRGCVIIATQFYNRAIAREIKQINYKIVININKILIQKFA